MTILKDGEKFACKQCIQGHRVSTCHHEERPLIHVARKGRPVSQCVHCRGLRKVRQTHVKCECGERRHSRTTSSESNTLYASDDSPCQCGPGKQCTCGLKKETNFELTLPSNDVAAANRSRKTTPTNRRSASAVPRSRNTYQPSMQRNLSSQDYGLQYSSASSNRRSYHHAQRSDGSIPLILESSQPLDIPPHPRASSGQFLSPSPIMHSSMPQRSNSDHQLLGINEDYRHFNVTLDKDILARTLSPQNPKRYSMNDWSMMTFNANDSSHMGMGSSGNSLGPDTAGYPFPAAIPAAAASPQWHEGWSSNVANTPPMSTLPRFHQPNYSMQHAGLSSSSTATASDYSESSWQQHTPDERRSSSFASVNAVLPSLNVDSSAAQQFGAYQDSADKVPDLGWAASPHQPELGFPVSVSDSSLPMQYGMSAQSMDNYSEASVNYAEAADFVFPGTQLRDSPQFDSGNQQLPSLPDRSIPSWSTSPPDSRMNTAFKFPPDDLYLSQAYTDQGMGKEWLTDENQYLEFIDSESPMTS